MADKTRFLPRLTSRRGRVGYKIKGGANVQVVGPEVATPAPAPEVPQAVISTEGRAHRTSKAGKEE